MRIYNTRNSLGFENELHNTHTADCWEGSNTGNLQGNKDDHHINTELL